MLENLEARFPQEDSNSMKAFNILGLHPLSTLSPKERAESGNEKLDMLISHYGQDQQHEFEEENQWKTQTADAIIDLAATRSEWSRVKELVVRQGYPTDSLPALWKLINKFDHYDFPAHSCQLGSHSSSAYCRL